MGWIFAWLGKQTLLQAGVFAAVAAIVLLGGTWSSMAGTLFLGLLGRAWIVHTAGVAGVLLCIPVFGYANWLLKHPENFAALASAMPWVVLGVVALKALVATGMVRALRRGGLIADRTLAYILGTWALVTAGLWALLHLLIPEALVSGYGLAGTVLVLVPLNRLLAAPLALAWNRHR